MVFRFQPNLLRKKPENSANVGAQLYLLIAGVDTIFSLYNSPKCTTFIKRHTPLNKTSFFCMKQHHC